MGLQRVPVVYLAGGMRSGWQDKVKEAFKGKPVMFIDPRDHGIAGNQEELYTAWDLEGVRRADIILAYLEADNPSGAGLALEVGFAIGLNEAAQAAKKKVLFICEPGHPHVRYFGMVRACSDEVVETLEDGLAGLDMHFFRKYFLSNTEDDV